MYYKCTVEKCPECDEYHKGYRCKCYDLESQYERYPDGCPCGNDSKWELIKEEIACDYCLCRKMCKDAYMKPLECDSMIHEQQYLKMPCKVDDHIFKISWYNKTGRKRYGINGFINEYIVVGAHLRDERSRRNIPREEYLVVRSIGYGSSSHIPFNQVGVTAFFSEEEAKAKLKEGPDQ